MEFHKASLPAIADGLRSGQIDLFDYLAETLRRVEATDAELRALLPEPGRRARLMSEAEALLAAYPDPADRPPLFGVPVGIKDLLHVDGLETRAGSFLPPEDLTAPEGTVIKRFRAAGALILGKTETDEFAHSEPPVTRNPRNLKHSPGGSSGGSAAAIAAGLCPIAVGTQTFRSIIGPASFCGTMGYKPSWETMPSDGLVYMCDSVDTIGFLAQDLASICLAAEVIGQVGPITPATAKPRLGVPRVSSMEALDPVARTAYADQLARLEAAGFELVEVALFDDAYLDEIRVQIGRVLPYEMARIHAPWFDRHEALYRERTHEGIVNGRKVTATEYAEGRLFQAEHRKKIEAAMDAAGIDLWVLPGSNGPAPETYHVTGWADMTGSWSFAGLGSLCFPADVVDGGLPLGLQFVPRYGDDAKLLGWGHQIEPVFADIAAQLAPAA